MVIYWLIIAMALVALPVLATVPDASEALDFLGMVSAWGTLPVLGKAVTAVMGISFVATWITALTPTPVDNDYASRLRRWAVKAYRLMELAGGNTALAKQQGSIHRAIEEAGRAYSKKSSGIIDQGDAINMIIDGLWRGGDTNKSKRSASDSNGQDG